MGRHSFKGRPGPPGPPLVTSLLLLFFKYHSFEKKLIKQAYPRSKAWLLVIEKTLQNLPEYIMRPKYSIITPFQNSMSKFFNIANLNDKPDSVIEYYIGGRILYLGPPCIMYHHVHPTYRPISCDVTVLMRAQPWCKKQKSKLRSHVLCVWYGIIASNLMRCPGLRDGLLLCS